MTTYEDTAPVPVSDLVAPAREPGHVWTKEPFPSDRQALGCVAIDPQYFIVTVNNEALSVTVQEFRLLAYLIKLANRPASLDELKGTLWSGVVILPSTIDRHVENLREKLRARTASPGIERGSDGSTALRIS